MFQEIDETGMEVLTAGGTVGDLLDSLNPEQLEYLRTLNITEWLADPDELTFAVDMRA